MKVIHPVQQKACGRNILSLNPEVT